MQLDARLDHVLVVQRGIVISQAIERNGVQFRVALSMHFVGLGGLENLVAFGSRRDVVFGDILADLVTDAVLERQLDIVALDIGNRDGIGRDGDARPIAAVVIGLFVDPPAAWYRR